MIYFTQRFPQLAKYGNAIIFPVVALLLSLAVFPMTHTSPFPLFMAAVALSAWQGGLPPATLTTVVSVIFADYFLTEPRYRFSGDMVNILQLSIFMGTAFLIIWMDFARRESVRELYDANRQLKIIVDNVANGITLQNADHQFLFINPTAAQIMGLPSPLALATTPMSYFQEKLIFQDEQGNAVPFHSLPGQRAVLEKKTQSQTLCLQYLEDEFERWLMVKAVPVWSDNDQVKFVVNIFEDITSQKRAEYELIRLAAIIEHSGDAIVSKTLDGIITTWNPAAQQIYGYSAEEVVGQPVSILYPEAIREHELELLPRIQHGERINHYETMRVRKDGTLIDISLTISPIIDQQGKITGYSSFARDVSPRRRLERLERESHVRLRNLIYNLPLPILQLDTQGCIMEANPIAAEINNCPRAELIGKPFETSYHWQYPEVIQQAIQHAIQGEAIRRDTTFWRGEEQVSLALNISPLYEGDTDINYLIVSGMDITNRKHTERALAQLAQELNRSNQELQQFAYIASHDLQEPLRTISSYLELLEGRYSHQLDPDAKEFIGFAVDGAKRMSKLIKGLLLYSRVQTKPQEFTQIESQTALARALNNLQVTIEDQGAQITHAPLPPIQADEDQIIQVFQNLISNAIKFRSEAPPHIHINAKKEEDKWHFSVQDNGIGIEAQYLERIFMVFQRLHSRREYEGTGIGLAVCQRIIERHGGQLWVESEPGKGSTFHFTIPMYQNARKKQ